MIEDYHNFSLEKCRDLIKKYQENKDVYIRDLLLAKFDKYLLHVMYDLRKKYSYLRGEELQGLYHTAVLGFYKALDVFDCTLSPNMIFFVVRSYVRNEFDIFYAYKAKELPAPDLIVRFEDLEFGHNKKHLDVFFTKCTVLILLDYPALKPIEKTFLEGIYCKGYSRKEMAKEYGCSEWTVQFYLKMALKKLRLALTQSGELPKKESEHGDKPAKDHK